MKALKWLAPCLAVLLPVFLLAQEPEESMRGPDGGTHYRVTGIEVLPAPDRPFSGVSTTEWTRTLEDGSVVTTHLFARVARDSQGRIYRERRHFVPASSDQQPPLFAIIILDPMLHTRTECEVATKHCIVTPYHAPTMFKPRPVGAFDSGRRLLTRENLGNDVADGINLVGTRETVTIAAGVIGNSQPLVTTREFWYSPDLQVNLATTRKDPREGTQVIRVSQVSRAEPDEALFKIPSGYALQNARRPDTSE